MFMQFHPSVLQRNPVSSARLGGTLKNERANKSCPRADFLPRLAAPMSWARNGLALRMPYLSLFFFRIRRAAGGWAIWKAMRSPFRRGRFSAILRTENFGV